jgi:hypothetical protein
VKSIENGIGDPYSEDTWSMFFHEFVNRPLWVGVPLDPKRAAMEIHMVPSTTRRSVRVVLSRRP